GSLRIGRLTREQGRIVPPGEEAQVRAILTGLSGGPRRVVCSTGPPSYDKKNSFAIGIQSCPGMWAVASSIATPPSCASAPSAIGIFLCRRLADSSVHHLASAPPKRLRKFVFASGDCTVTSQPSP